MGVERASVETLQVQLCQLHEKMRFYVGRLWQLPFVYLAISGTFALQDSLPSDPLITVGGSSVLLLVGVACLLATRTIHSRINATVSDLEETEGALSLEPTVAYWSTATIAPYYAIIVLGLVASATHIL